jgi:hypothetical protein
MGHGRPPTEEITMTTTTQHIPAIPGTPASELFARILNAPLPAFRGNIRRDGRSTWGAKVRRLFADLGIKGISVTTPSYSMAQSIDIRLPGEAEHDYREEWQGGTHERATCPICRERQAAVERVEEIILAAFPDLDNRSDSQTDHYDYCLGIN